MINNKTFHKKSKGCKEILHIKAELKVLFMNSKYEMIFGECFFGVNVICPTFIDSKMHWVAGWL